MKAGIATDIYKHQSSETLKEMSNKSQQVYL